MDYFELLIEMDAIVKEKNPFLRYYLLTQLEKDYKTTDFAKLSKMNVFTAYDWYYRQRGSTLAAIMAFGDADLEKITENYDVNKLFDKLDPNNREFLEALGINKPTS